MNLYSGVVRDAAGNLFGTSLNGGTGSNSNCNLYGQTSTCGTAYKIDTSGKETVLYDFTGGTDGGLPYANVILDSAGNLYGTTYVGGANGDGAVFKLDTSGHETVLYSFKGYQYGDGGFPYSGLIMDAAGNLYGTTYVGGTGTGCAVGCGTVFKLDTSGHETVLYSFTGGNDGKLPASGSLAMDSQGNLYGNAQSIGRQCAGAGCGEVYQLTTTGKLNLLHVFNGSDGNGPQGTLIFDSKGKLYGVTGLGGTYDVGTIWTISPKGAFTSLHSFNGTDGGYPTAGVIRDGKGNLFGTGELGGNLNCNVDTGCGTVFEFTHKGKSKVLYTFDSGPEGAFPLCDLVMDGAGTLYGTSGNGTNPGQYGTVWEITKQ